MNIFNKNNNFREKLFIYKKKEIKNIKNIKNCLLNNKKLSKKGKF